MDLFVFRGIEYLKLFLWAVPGLPILAAVGWWKNRQLTGLRLLGWSAVSSCFAFLLVPFSQGHGWGDRYFHQAWGTLPLLAAAFLVCPGPSRASWVRIMGVLATLSLVTGTTLRFYQVHDFISTQVAQMPPELEGEHQICFIDTDFGFYRQDRVQNDPWLRDPRVTLLSSGRQRDASLVRHIDPGAKRIYDNGHDTVWLVRSGPETWTLGGEPILGK